MSARARKRDASVLPVSAAASLLAARCCLGSLQEPLPLQEREECRVAFRGSPGTAAVQTAAGNRREVHMAQLEGAVGADGMADSSASR